MHVSALVNPFVTQIAKQRRASHEPCQSEE